MSELQCVSHPGPCDLVHQGADQRSSLRLKVTHGKGRSHRLESTCGRTVVNDKSVLSCCQKCSKIGLCDENTDRQSSFGDDIKSLTVI